MSKKAIIKASIKKNETENKVLILVSQKLFHLCYTLIYIQTPNRTLVYVICIS